MAIRIHASDTDEQVEKRHRDVLKRLDELGPGRVRDLVASGGLPTNWNLIINAWLKDK